MDYEKKVLYISRYAKEKRIADYYNIAKEVPNMFFYHIGSGNKGVIEGLTDLPNLMFLGYVSEPEKNQILRSCDIYITTSIAEGFNVTILEALKNNLLILARDLKVYHELFEDYPVYCDNVAEFVFALDNYSNHEYKRKKKDFLRKYLIHKYTWEKSAERLRAIIEEL